MEIITVAEDKISTLKTDIATKPALQKSGTGPDVNPSNPRLSRKRTKTGCLTCRKRRIKCDEERPTCGNCAKSKRQCQGYNQRVIFKDPLNIYRGSSSFKGSKSSKTKISSTPHHGQDRDAKSVPQPPLHSNASKVDSPRENVPLEPSKPSPPLVFPGQSIQVTDQRVYSGGQSSGPDTVLDDGFHCIGRLADVSVCSLNPTEYHKSPKQQAPDPLGPQYRISASHMHTFGLRETPSPSTLPPGGSNSPGHALESSPHEVVYKSNTCDATSVLTQSQQGSGNWTLSAIQSNASHPSRVLYSETHSLPTPGEQIFPDADSSPDVKSGPRLDVFQVSGDHPNLFDRYRPVVFEPAIVHCVPTIDGMERQAMTSGDGASQKYNSDIYLGYQRYQQSIVSRNELDTFDECVSVGDQDRDSEIKMGEHEQDHLKNNDLGIFVALQATQDQRTQSLRTYHSLIHSYAPNMLATYQPLASSSPLNDCVAARIFCHFINVIAPSISIFERSPANPSLLFQGRPVHISQQHIWAYTMPTLAFNNQDLLHAMLAIGSLHIARIEDCPITSSLKHYHIALRRIAKNVGLPTRRSQPATLAATMLLGWYEVMSADHQKWCNHVLGARQLLKEIDFAQVTRYLKFIKSQRRGRPYHHSTALGINEPYSGKAEYLQWEDEVDEHLLSMVMGRKLHLGQCEQVLDNGTGSRHKAYTPRDLEVFETQMDLFWWYCKQDMYQSILSGSRLFLPYDSWSHCLPRAPLGRINAIHGTSDHLILVLGRLADFTAKDLRRKRKVMQLNGHRSRSLSKKSERLNSPAQVKHSELWLSNDPAQGAQLAAGMIPGTEGKATLPRGFSPDREEYPIDLNSEDHSLESQTIEAEKEWHEIRSAFDILADRFGSDFQALGPECSPAIQTPFGPALQYRTYSISCIWASYYMGLVLCHRVHPSMPPIATVAAGIAARETGFFANQIGRIAAGIAPDSPVMTQIDATVGAALIEISFGLFVAGVQYQDSGQRHWLVQKSQDITRLTGWQTAQTIGSACEASWSKAAEAGKGPAYVRVTENKALDSIKPPHRRIDLALQERKYDNTILKVSRPDRVHYALGLIGVEDDFRKLDLEGDDTP